MIKKALLVAAVLLAGTAGFVSAETAHTIAVKEIGHERISELKERINIQLSRIDLGIADNTLTADEAQACRAVLTNVQTQMQVEHAANGPGTIMSREKYEAYNTALDMNSSVIHEEKGSYYGRYYYDQHWYSN